MPRVLSLNEALEILVGLWSPSITEMLRQAAADASPSDVEGVLDSAQTALDNARRMLSIPNDNKPTSI